MESINFTEEDIFQQVNRHAPLDGRAMPRLGKGGTHRTGKCTRCGKPSHPYSLCRYHRELGSIKRVMDGLVDEGLVERVTDGRGSKGGAKYRQSEKGRLACIKKPFVREAAKVGRNDPCPCSSGRKYKHCCGTTKRGEV